MLSTIRMRQYYVHLFTFNISQRRCRYWILWTMWYWLDDRWHVGVLYEFLESFIKSAHRWRGAKIAVMRVVLRFLPSHRLTKGHRSTFTNFPMRECRITVSAHNMRHVRPILVRDFETEISTIILLNTCTRTYLVTILLHNEFTANITKFIGWINTRIHIFEKQAEKKLN